MGGFRLDHTLFGADIPYEHLQLAPSQDVNPGDALKLVYGKLALAGTTDKVYAVAQQKVASSATNLKQIRIKLACRGLAVFRKDISLSELTALANTDPLNVKLTQGDIAGDGNANDLRGGYVLRVSTGERRMIASNSYGSSINTIVVAEPFSSPVAVGEKVKVLPLGASDVTVQLNGEDAVALTIAGRSSGNLSIFEVGPLLDYILVTFNP